ncbi:hypothetical protein THIOSC15_3030007 [uncultured Thiomicrorhabdus sp.]
MVGEENDDDHSQQNQDVIVVDQNISSALDLGKGDDYVLVGNDLSSGLEYDNKTGNISDYGSNAALLTGPGDDSVYIVNDAFSPIDLGTGDDRFVMGGSFIKRYLQGMVMTRHGYRVAIRVVLLNKR